MDRVRLGRALGRGARLAAKTAYEAMDAAAAPDPSSHRSPPSSQTVQQRSSARRVVAPSTVLPKTHLRASGVRAGASMLSPFKKASRAVSLEVTGSFFALFALSFFVGLWHVRSMLHAGTSAVFRFGAGCLIALLFSYFAVSNFRRAARLQ